MIKWIINKSSRLISDIPYAGPSCDSAGVEPNKIYENWQDAVTDAQKLTAVNPVGFVVIPISTDYKLYNDPGLRW